MSIWVSVSDPVGKLEKWRLSQVLQLAGDDYSSLQLLQFYDYCFLMFQHDEIKMKEIQGTVKVLWTSSKIYFRHHHCKRQLQQKGEICEKGIDNGVTLIQIAMTVFCV